MIGQDTVAALLEGALGEMGQGIPASEIKALLETPKDSAHGDIAFPCFQLARALRKAPPAIAADLAAKLGKAIEGGSEISKVVATGPYLNFFLNKASLAGVVIPAVINGEFLARRPSSGERVMVEYGSVNTHKSFHVGHIRNVALGDSIARLFEIGRAHV